MCVHVYIAYVCDYVYILYMLKNGVKNELKIYVQNSAKEGWKQKKNFIITNNNNSQNRIKLQRSEMAGETESKWERQSHSRISGEEVRRGGWMYAVIEEVNVHLLVHSMRKFLRQVSSARDANRTSTDRKKKQSRVHHSRYCCGGRARSLSSFPMLLQFSLFPCFIVSCSFFFSSTRYF